MKKSQQQFLELLRSSLWEREETPDLDEEINWEEIYSLAQIHKCVPMIYDTSKRYKSFFESNKKLADEWQSSANTTAFAQIHKREKFLQLYKNLIENQVEILVFKGMIISRYYPSYEKRNYMTEDILIKKEDLSKVKEILAKNNFERKIAKEEGSYVLNYYCPTSALYLQVHICLFKEEFKYKDKLGSVFEHVYENCEVVNIDGVDVYTFSTDEHLIYIIYNAIRDFTKRTIRIRQIADMTMFIEANSDRLNWEHIWKFFENLGDETLVVNFLQMAIDYLGLDESKIIYSKDKNLYYFNNVEILTEEILDGGLYGEKFSHNIEENILERFYKGKKEKNKYDFLMPTKWIKNLLL